MPERLLRTFIAIAVPRTVNEVQGMLKTTIDKRDKAIKWVKPNSIHLTLKFIGPTQPDMVPIISERLQKLVLDFQPLELRITGTGCFPDPRRPRVLWLGMEGDTDGLKSVAKAVHGSLVDLGFPDESKKFVPHITLARIRYPQKKTPDIDSFLSSEYNNITMRTDRIHLLSSELLPSGAVYSNLGTFHFTS